MENRAQAPGTLYPRVRVREQPDPNSLQEETASLILRVIELEGHYPSNVPASKHGSDHKSDSPLPHSAISSACPSNLSTSCICNGSEVYPGVKVREQPDPNSLKEETASLVLRVIELEGGYPSNVPTSKLSNDYESDSPLPHSLISSACPSHLSTSPMCHGSEERNKKSLDQDKKPNIRASSVPRPRAVLSSPDNDNMIGHQNQLSRKERILKGQQPLRERAAAQCKPTLKNVRVQSPVNSRETTKVTGNNNRPKTKPSLAHEKTIRQTPGKGKANPAWI